MTAHDWTHQRNHAPKSRRGYCPVCLCLYVVTSKGGMRAHKRSGVECEGTGLRPSRMEEVQMSLAEVGRVDDVAVDAPKPMSHAERCLAIVEHNGRSLTAPEIAERASLEEYQARRRLSELRNRGKVEHDTARLCDVKQTKMVTWRLAQ